MTSHPHQGQPVLMAGPPLGKAQAAMIMVHGRGATAESILTLTAEFDAPGFAYLAPQAANNTWYPHSFLAPIAQNEPGLSSALTILGDIINQIDQAGLPPNRVMLLGFSQGACLSAEFVARHPQRYGGIAVLSGGLIGAAVTAQQYSGSLAHTPIFLGCSDVDFHIPKSRVEESAAILAQMEAAVTSRLYPGMGHIVNQDEIDQVQAMITQLI